MIIHGHNLVVGTLSSGTFTAIAQARGCTLNIDTDFVETGSPWSGESRDFVPKRYSWTIECNGLMCASDSSLPTSQLSNTAMSVSFREKATGGISYSGIAYIKSIKFTGNVRELASYSVTLQGTGILSITTV